MTTVRITDSLKHDLTVRLRNQFRPAIQKAVDEAAKATDEMLAQNREALRTMLNKPWGEHLHLRDLMPADWCNTPSNRISVNVRVPDPTEPVVAKAMANLSSVDEPSTISMAGFSWTPDSDQEANALAEPDVAIDPDTVEFNIILRPLEFDSLTSMTASLEISERECVLPPNRRESYFVYDISAYDLCPDQASLLPYMATLYAVGDLRDKAEAAERGLVKVLNNVPSVNRLLKEYPQFEPIIPDGVLRKVREKVNRGPRTPTERDEYEALGSDEMAALQTAAVLSGLN